MEAKSVVTENILWFKENDIIFSLKHKHVIHC